jgi:hypothetical protein
MDLATITSGGAITWGDLLIILAVIALLIIIFGGWGRWRR